MHGSKIMPCLAAKSCPGQTDRRKNGQTERQAGRQTDWRTGAVIDTDLIANSKVVEIPGLGTPHLVAQAAPLRVSCPAHKLNQVQSILHPLISTVTT